MKYVSVDTETLGLNEEKDMLIEAGLIVADTNEEFELTATNHLRIVLCRQSLSGDVYAFTMHTELLKEIRDVLNDEFKKPRFKENISCTLHKKIDKGIYTENVLYVNLSDYMFDLFKEDEDCEVTFYTLVYETIDNFLRENGLDTNETKLNIAGKNFAGFDAKFIKQNGSMADILLKKSRHRVLDVGNMYVMPDDEYVPDLKTCLERGGIIKQVAHTSIDDALDVVNLVQEHFARLKELTESV